MTLFQKRSIALSIVLCFITCGIYEIYWYYVIARDLYECNTPNRVDMSPVMIILLNIITCGIYGIYVYYKWGKQMTEVTAMYGRPVEDRSVLYLLLAIFLGVGPIVNMALIQNDFNNMPVGGVPPQGGGYQPPPPGSTYGG